VTDPDRLAEIREYLDALYGKNVAGPKDLIDVKVETLDWLVGEVERLREERAELVATAAYGAKEMTRLRGLLRRLEWAGRKRSSPDRNCPACFGWPANGHDPGCELAAELNPPTSPGPPEGV
jgi:hypothetical protein